MAHLKSLTVNGVDIIDLIYPVGSFYLSTKDTPPLNCLEELGSK